MNNWDFPLTWGLTADKTEELLSKYGMPFAVRRARVTISSSDVVNFPGDCGSLILLGANYVTKIILEAVKELASKGGFDKVFATLVRCEYEGTKAIFEEAGWQVLSVSPSNRNPEKTAVALFLHINDPEYKGY